MVLLAVQRFERLTRAAMLNSAPLRPPIFPVRPLMMKSMPPLCRMTSSIPPARRVTMISSPIPVIPSPMLAARTAGDVPLMMPIARHRSTPAARTITTLIPQKAIRMTEK